MTGTMTMTPTTMTGTLSPRTSLLRNRGPARAAFRMPPRRRATPRTSRARATSMLRRTITHDNNDLNHVSNNKIVKIVANALSHVSNNKIEDSYTDDPNPNYFGRTPGGYLGEKFCLKPGHYTLKITEGDIAVAARAKVMPAAAVEAVFNDPEPLSLAAG